MILFVPALSFTWFGYRCLVYSPFADVYCVSGDNGVHWLAVVGDERNAVGVEFMEQVFAIEEGNAS